MSKKKQKAPPAQPELTKVEVRPEQAKYLVELNQAAQAAAQAAQQQYDIAASAILAGRVGAGSQLVKVDVDKGILYVREPAG